MSAIRYRIQILEITPAADNGAGLVKDTERQVYSQEFGEDFNVREAIAQLNPKPRRKRGTVAAKTAK